MVYLICFDRPFKHSRHYLGFSAEDPEKRFQRHKSNHGAKLLRALNLEGIDYKIVRTWDMDGKFERLLKKRKNSKFLCPVCNPDGYLTRGKVEPL